MPREEVGIDFKGFLFADADNGIYPCFLEERRAAPVDAGIRVYDGYDALRNACLNKGIGARRGLAVMRTRLERNVDARALCLLARNLQCIGFSVRTPAIRGYALPDNFTLFNYDAAHSGVFTRAALLRPREREGFLHILLMTRQF